MGRASWTYVLKLPQSVGTHVLQLHVPLVHQKMMQLMDADSSTSLWRQGFVLHRKGQSFDPAKVHGLVFPENAHLWYHHQSWEINGNCPREWAFRFLSTEFFQHDQSCYKHQFWFGMMYGALYFEFSRHHIPKTKHHCDGMTRVPTTLVQQFSCMQHGSKERFIKQSVCPLFYQTYTWPCLAHLSYK